MTIQMKAIQQYFHVVLFIMLYTVNLTLKSVDEALVILNKGSLVYSFDRNITNHFTWENEELKLTHISTLSSFNVHDWTS